MHFGMLPTRNRRSHRFARCSLDHLLPSRPALHPHIPVRQWRRWLLRLRSPSHVPVLHHQGLFSWRHPILDSRRLRNARIPLPESPNRFVPRLQLRSSHRRIWLLRRPPHSQQRCFHPWKHVSQVHRLHRLMIEGPLSVYLAWTLLCDSFSQRIELWYGANKTCVHCIGQTNF